MDIYVVLALNAHFHACPCAYGYKYRIVRFPYAVKGKILADFDIVEHFNAH